MTRRAFRIEKALTAMLLAFCILSLIGAGLMARPVSSSPDFVDAAFHTAKANP